MTPPGCQDVRTSAPSTSPGAAEQEAGTSKICGLIILSFSFIVGGGKMGVCYCAGQIRKNKSPALNPPVAQENAAILLKHDMPQT